MSARKCSRIWQVEAVWDGCLSASDVSSFERHLEICAECRKERALLERMQSMAERLPSPTTTPLQRRALQQQLLRRANELATAEPRSFWRGRGGLSLALGCAALFSVGLGLSHFRQRGSAQTQIAVAAAEPSFDLTGAPGSRWRVLEHGRSLRLGCDEGRLEIAVHKLQPGQRFAVALPDGELEVRGTRFAIEVSGQRTRHLSVSEGRVALRLRGRSEMSFGAGQAWSATDESPALELALPPATSDEPQAVSASNTGGTPAASVRRSPASKPLPAQAKPTGALPVEGLGAPGPAEDFAAAMAAFSRSDFGTAEHLLTSFGRRYPNSPHREDVLFLRAVCRKRRGDADGARALAREYLSQFPEAFRAPEARRMAEP